MMDWEVFLTALHSGDDRIQLPTFIYLCIVGIVCLAQWGIAITDRLSTGIKQLLSIPTMIACLLLPVMVAGQNTALNTVLEIQAFNTVLRCLEPIYVAPILYGIPARLDIKELSVQMWSGLRNTTTTPNNHQGDASSSNSPKVSRYYLLVPMMGSMILSNMVASWFATFSGEDVFAMQRNNEYGLFFAFFVFAVIYLTLVINTFGYILQLTYLVIHGEHDYQPDEWQPLMNHPVLASSLNELWSSRWHQVFRSIWLVIPFRPMRTLVNRVYGIRDDDNGDKKREKATTSRVAIAAATISVFFVSGLMHEYIALCESGIDGYGRLLIGQECFFFTLHGVLCIVEQGLWRWFKKTSHRQWTRKLLGHIWVMAIGFLTFPWFVNAFAYWEVWHANPFNTLTPFLLEHVWRKYPFLHSVCGSLL
ncbi:hypothetical protein O0I10_006978 [Lichtheimia ornata]|uniref:Wax synthase domain-containing protein n=1 Tax=Lichtheimia ornata TaxID=688661 RepID=A0AAD7V3H6_9FUNG|nr:uncharacterized protein O0I10_006978 [Lichtheimia ornata]KAJ8657422.1 hypothetical protein O0I10_006978 [Lichtheimia ornata]